MKKDEKSFLYALLAIIIILLIFGAVSFYLSTIDNTNALRFALIIVFVAVLILTMIFLWTTLSIYRVINDKKISKINYKLLKVFLGNVYPLIIWISKAFKIDIDNIRRVFGKVNNFIVKTKNIRVEKNELLILLPHCLQDSKCEYKITNDINNCRMCGKCDIKDIVDLCNKYNVEAVVATGGTLAREWIKKKRPKAIIAVACERDLASGINDVKVIPVMGVFNQRPNGPCFDTKVNIKSLEEGIKTFLEEE